MTAIRHRSILTCLLLTGGWLVLTGLMWRPDGNLDGYLTHVFGRYSRDDAFHGVSRIAGFFWCLHSLLCLIAFFAVHRQRFDILAVLFVGPCLAALFLGFEEDWSDPAWFTIIAIECLGYMAGISVTLVWWGGKSLLDRYLPLSAIAEVPWLTLPDPRRE